MKKVLIGVSLFSLLLIAGCTFTCVDESFNEIYSNWTQCINNNQIRNATNSCGESIIETRACDDITIESFMVSLGDLGSDYNRLELDRAIVNESLIVGVLGGVNYTRAALGYEDGYSLTVYSNYTDYDDYYYYQYGIGSSLSVYSADGVKTRFDLEKAKLNESYEEITGYEVGTESFLYYNTYNYTSVVTNETVNGEEYYQVFYNDQFWVYSNLYGDLGDVVLQDLIDFNELINSKINDLLIKEQAEVVVADELTLEGLLPSLNDLGADYNRVKVDKAFTNASLIVGAFEGVNYTRADLGFTAGYDTVTYFNYTNPPLYFKYALSTSFSTYDNNISIRFNIQKSVLEADNNYELISNNTIGTESVTYYYPYNYTNSVTNETVSAESYVQLFYIEPYWVYSIIYGDMGDVVLQDLIDYNTMIEDKINIII
ncbi:MAG: hypothetical protein WC307_05550 [Candidatus Nanoarchaeia archaeon]|jgi:hypothetical protein